MNKKHFEIFKQYRKRKYERDLDYLRNESGLKAQAFTKEDERLKGDYEDEVEMEKEKTDEWEKEQRSLRVERFISKITNIALTLVAILSFVGTVWFSSITIKNSQEANSISLLTAEQEYYNQQPFLIIVGGNNDATSVKIKNVGSGPAKDIFFLKHHGISEAKYEYALTKEEDVILGVATGAEGDVNLNSQFMDELNADEVLEKIKCLRGDLLVKRTNTWVMIFYRNIQGDLFVSHIIGSGSPYGEAVVFEKLSCNDNLP